MGKDIEQVGMYGGWSQEEAAMPDRLMGSGMNQVSDGRSYPSVSDVQPHSSCSLEHDPSLRGVQYLSWVFLYFIGNFGYHRTGRDGSQQTH